MHPLITTTDRKEGFSLPPSLAHEGQTLLLHLAGVALLALSSQLRLPAFPVPYTLQTLALLILALSRGASSSLSTVLTYLLLGSVGVPLFANLLPPPLWLASPTAGYLIGFLGAAYLVGRGSEKSTSSFSLFLYLCAGELSIYSCGFLSLLRFVPWNEALAVGVFPFLPSEALKVAFALLLSPLFMRLRRTIERSG